MREFGKVVMTPDELPRQRLHTVVLLPACPQGFEITAFAGNPEPPTYKNMSRRKALWTVAVVEWAWSPMHERLDTYVLERRPRHWALWNYNAPGEVCWSSQLSLMAIAPALDVAPKTAAMHLLKAAWTAERDAWDTERFHFVDDADLLSVGELMGVARTVWPARQRRDRKPTSSDPSVWT